MAKEVSAMGRGEEIQGLSGGSTQPDAGALGVLAQVGFEFGKG